MYNLNNMQAKQYISIKAEQNQYYWKDNNKASETCKFQKHASLER